MAPPSGGAQTRPSRPANGSLTAAAFRDYPCGEATALARARARSVSRYAAMSQPTFRLLGPLESEQGGEPVAIGGQKQRAVLALLLLRAGEVVSTDRLIQDLWGENPPRTAATSLQNAVSQLRKALGAETLVTRGHGYLVDIDQVDAHRFERLVRRARGEDPEPRARLLREALELWRGPALADFTYESFAQGEIKRLEDLQLAALEELIDAELELGRAAELVGELEALVDQNPLRERLRGQLMLALYRSG